MAGVLEYAIKLNTSAFTAPLGAASNMLRGFTGAAGTAAGVLAKVAAPLAALGGGITALSALNKAANFEQLSVSLRVLIGDAKETESTLQGLKKFANATPFEFNDIAEAGKTLIALGGSTKTLIPELKALGDVSSGLGIPINEIAIAYGRARADGVLYAETLNQFGDKGIAIYEMLAKQLGVTTTEVKKMAAEGQITFPYLQKVLSDLTTEGGRFHGMMQEQSGTTKGLLSTLKSALDELLVSLATPVNDFLKPIIAANIQRMQALNVQVKSFLTLMAGASKEGKLGEFLGTSLQLGVIKAVNLFSSGIRGAVAYLAAALPPVFQAGVEILTSPKMQIFFTAIFRGMGEVISGTIKSALSSLPGLGELADRGAEDQSRGLTYFRMAGNVSARADWGKSFETLADGLSTANEAGRKAIAQASKDELIPTGKLQERFDKIAKSINAEAWGNLMNPVIKTVNDEAKSLEEALGGLNLSIEKSAAKPKPETKNTNPGGYGISQSAEVPGGRPRGLLGLADSVEARLSRRSAADTRKDFLSGASGISQADTLGLRRLKDREPGLGGRLINPERAADALGRANRGADPGRTRRDEKAEQARRSADPIYGAVKSIEEKLSQITSA